MLGYLNNENTTNGRSSPNKPMKENSCKVREGSGKEEKRKEKQLKKLLSSQTSISQTFTETDPREGGRTTGYQRVGATG